MGYRFVGRQIPEEVAVVLASVVGVDRSLTAIEFELKYPFQENVKWIFDGLVRYRDRILLPAKPSPSRAHNRNIEQGPDASAGPQRHLTSGLFPDTVPTTDLCRISQRGPRKRRICNRLLSVRSLVALGLAKMSGASGARIRWPTSTAPRVQDGQSRVRSEPSSNKTWRPRFPEHSGH